MGLSFLLPPQTQLVTGTPSITASPPKFTWTNKNLKADFNLQFTAPSGGPQQGRIVVLARGGSALLSHPSGALNLPVSPTLITPSKGEYFSVSRFREVNVELPLNKSDNLVSTLEVMIFNSEGKLLIYQTHAIPAGSQKSSPAPKAKTSPSNPQAKPKGSELIEPGTDQ